MHTAVLRESCAKGESIFFRGVVLDRLPMAIDGSNYSRDHMAALTGLSGLEKKTGHQVWKRMCKGLQERLRREELIQFKHTTYI